MNDVITLLSGDLPRQSAVYVVFDLKEHEIHVLSTDVSAKYSIVRAMRPELLNQIAENGRRDGCMDVGDGLFATPQQYMLLQHLEDVMESCDYYTLSDKAGYYNGVPGRTIISRFCPQSLVEGFEMLDMTYSPFNRYHISEERLREEMDSIPVARDGVYGPVELVGGGADGKLSVSMNMRHFPPSPYIIAKLDLLCSLGEHQFHEDYIFCEKMLSSEMNTEELEQVRNRAVNIMGILVNHPDTRYEPIDPDIRGTLSRCLAGQWPVQMHDHIVIDA